MEYLSDLARAIKNKKQNATFLSNLKRKQPKNLDDQFHESHQVVFEEIDCLKCANCCKTTSPIFIHSDIERISKKLRMPVLDFTKQYLRIDGDGDHVLQTSPCVFLAEDNTCDIYDYRPRACREYPHTDRKRMYQIMDLTTKNTIICPAVIRIVERIQSVTA